MNDNQGITPKYLRNIGNIIHKDSKTRDLEYWQNRQPLNDEEYWIRYLMFKELDS